MNSKMLKPGDVISAARTVLHIHNAYKHFGIYVGSNRVVHFTALGRGHETDPNLAYVQETTLEAFLAGDECSVESCQFSTFKRDVIVKRARSFVGKGEGTYNLVLNNCEHFAVWCATGVYYSSQVEKYAKRFLGMPGKRFMGYAAARVASRRWKAATRANGNEKS